jgi:RNase P/RNase MRP subunit p30
MGPYYDLNVPYPKAKAHRAKLLSTAERLGYAGVAWTLQHECGSPVPHANIAMPIQQVGGIRQLRRVTLAPPHPDALRKALEAPNLHSYDIVGVEVGDGATLTECLASPLVGLITIRGYGQIHHLQRWPLAKAKQQGLCFEVLFAPALRAPRPRTPFISPGRVLARVLGRQNIVMSSGATGPLELRGPHDVAAMALLFGVDPNTARHYVGSNAASVVERGDRRTERRPSHCPAPSIAIPVPRPKDHPAPGDGDAGGWVLDTGGIGSRGPQTEREDTVAPSSVFFLLPGPNQPKGGFARSLISPDAIYIYC